jgi:signal peptide peptidase SppA
MKNLRIAELLFNQPLLISEAKLNVILHALGPRFNLDLSGYPVQEAAVLSDQDRRKAGYVVQDGVAVIGIYGPLMHRLMASEYPSGGPTTYGEIRRTFDTALADDGVSAVLLDIDSPGGMVSGAFDLADHIYQSRSVKPITAMVNESAFSAGYLLASSAGRIIMPRTAEVGSVGVIATHADFSRAEDQAGITVTHVYAGSRKAYGSPHMPLSAEAFSDLQSSVNETYQLFVDTVARNRGLATEAVRGTEAGIYKAKQAVAIKFADEIGTSSMAFASATSRNRSRVITASAEPIGKEKKTMKLEELKTAHPDLCQALIEEGKQMAAADNSAAIETARREGAAAELARIKGIEEQCSVPGHEQLVATLKYDGATTPEQAALQILGAETQLRKGALATMQNEANPAVPAAAVSATGEREQAAKLPADAPVDERAKAEWDSNPALKKEFTSESAYVAFRKNEEAGRARILKK